jgi:DNA-directed RNA polymerase subunit F
MGDKYTLTKIDSAGAVEIEIDKCDQCGKVLDVRTDTVLLEVSTDRIFCVSCVLRNEGATKIEIADPVVENGKFPIIERNRFAKARDETDAEYRRRIFRDDIFQKIVTDLKSVWGEGTRSDAQSVIGQLLATFSEDIAAENKLIEEVVNIFNVETATGEALDQLAELMPVTPKDFRRLLEKKGKDK